jgi:drug/metabolite transporter (DMT)-like permease
MALTRPEPQSFSPANVRRGLFFQFLASVSFAVMGAFVYWAHQLEPDASSLLASFVRVIVNLLLLVVAAAAAGDIRSLKGDGRSSLWLRGFFGGFSLVLSFAGIQAIGVADSGFLHTTNAVFIAALSPMILGQRNSWRVWIVVVVGLFGSWLLMHPRFDDGHNLGRIFALASGFCAAIAYMMVSRAGKSNRPSTIIFYFCVVATMIHVVLLPFAQTSWPTDYRYWGALVGAGAAASVAQWFMTRGYQNAPATLNSLMGYSSPVVSLAISCFIFAKVPDEQSLLGASVIIACGMILPFIERGTKKPRSKELAA